MEEGFLARRIYGNAESRNVVIEDIVALLRWQEVCETLLGEV